jgi:hypothetical protein
MKKANIHFVSANRIRACLILAALLFACIGLSAQPQDWLWARSAGGVSYDSGQSVAVDGDGNSYITGNFEETALFGATSLTSQGQIDIFVAKIDSNGNWLWAVHAGGTLNDYGYCIAVDALGNVYVTGLFEDVVSFGGTTLTANDYAEIFVAKLDANGNWLWAKRAGGTDWDVGYGIAVDGTGHSYISGTYTGTATFGSFTLTNNTAIDTFVAKLDTDGNWMWAQQTANTGAGWATGYGFDIDISGNCYVTGYFNGAVTFGASIITASGYVDIYAAKLDAQGNWLWAKKAGGTGYDYGFAITADNFGNCFVTGYFQGYAYFGANAINSTGNNEVFAAKLDGQGNWLWARNAGGSSSDEGHGIATDSAGNCYITGFFRNTATFGGFALVSSGFIDIYAAKLDPDGNWLWVKKAGGTGWDYAKSIAVDSAGNSYVTGYYNGTSVFDLISLPGNGEQEVFLAKLTATVSDADDELASPSAYVLDIYPNPFRTGETVRIKANIADTGGGILSLFNLRGECVARHILTSGQQQIAFDGKDLPSGIYLCRLETRSASVTQKLVLLK